MGQASPAGRATPSAKSQKLLPLLPTTSACSLLCKLVTQRPLSAANHTVRFAMTTCLFSRSGAAALLVCLASCNLITVGGSGKSFGQPTNSGTTSGSPTAAPSGTDASPRPRMMQRPLERAAADGIIVEEKLRNQYCAQLNKLGTPLMSRLAASQKISNPLTQLDQHAKILLDVAAMTATLQAQYDAAYQTQSRAASQSNIAGDVGIGYGTISNSTKLHASEAWVEVLVSATKIMSVNALPFSNQKHGLAAGAVVMVGRSDCESPRLTALAKQLAVNLRTLVAPFDVNNAQLAEPLPVVVGKVLSIRGEVTSTKPFTVRITTEQNHYNNCTTTNRFDHFDANGNVRYQEKCKYTGSSKGVVTVVASGAQTVVPADLNVNTGDQVRLLGRVLSNDTKDAARGKTFLRTTQVAIAPLVFIEIARKNTLLYSY